METCHWAAVCSVLLLTAGDENSTTFWRTQTPPSDYTATDSAPPGCGQVVFSDRIVGGKDALQGKWPWQVSIVYQNSHICGGSLVSRNWVVSAAHCFPSSTNISKLQILLGGHSLLNLSSHAVILPVKKVIIHPIYSGDGTSGDLALVEMEREVNVSSYIRPICLPSPDDQFPNGKMCWVTGWGYIKNGVHLAPPFTMQEVEVPIINPSTCNAIYQATYNLDPMATVIHSDMICAGYPEGQKDACQGDSGGPLACKSGNSWFLTGIVSWGDGCAEPNRPGVYTMVSNFSSWLQKTIPGIRLSTTSHPNDTSTEPTQAVFNYTVSKIKNYVITDAGESLRASVGLSLASLLLCFLSIKEFA